MSALCIEWVEERKDCVMQFVAGSTRSSASTARSVHIVALETFFRPILVAFETSISCCSRFLRSFSLSLHYCFSSLRINSFIPSCF
jgi:hypothetical protein